jgi:hypothetical protein
MASNERHIGQGEDPDHFASIQRFSETKRIRKLSAGLEGIDGPSAESVAFWNKMGWGRLISVPASSLSGDSAESNRHQNIAYVLPLTDEEVKGHDKRVLVIFAANGGRNNKSIIISPAQSDHEDPEVEEIENENYLRDFDVLFTPSTRPAVIEEWETRPEASAMEAFFSNLAILPVEIYLIDNKEADAVFTQALETAYSMYLNRISTDEYSMRQMDLGPELTSLFEVAHTDWDHLKGERNADARKVLFRKNKPKAA